MSNPQIISRFISFVNILSIKVADCWVKLTHELDIGTDMGELHLFYVSEHNNSFS